jgi:hypothetical protein
MYYKYFIEFIGTLTILYAKIYTDAFFSPLAVFIQYSLGRINGIEAMYYLIAQYSAAILIILTFIPIKTFMQRMV